MRANRTLGATIQAAAAAAVGGNATGQAPTTVPIVATIKLSAEVTSLAAVPISGEVVAGLADGRVVRWDARSAGPGRSLAAHGARVLAAHASAAGELSSVAADGTLARSTSTAASASQRKLDLGPATPRAAAFSADGALVVIGGDRGELRVFDIATGTLRRRLMAHRTELHTVVLRPGTSVVASASAEADLRIWDAGGGRDIASIDTGVAMLALAFSPQDGTLATGGVDRRLTLREPTVFKAVGELALAAPLMVASLAWSPDGRLIAVGDLDDRTLSKGGLRVVAAAGRALVATLETEGVPAAALVFAGRGDVVVGASGPLLRSWTLPGAAAAVASPPADPVGDR